MVTRGIDNWQKHKEDVFDVFRKRYGEERTKKFIDFYANRYDKYNRTFIDYKLAFWLFDDYNHVKNLGTRWFAFVGVGGTGKSTLAKNVFSFFDETFKLDRIATNVRDFVKILHSFPTTDAMKAVLMDEPDDSVHASSPQGKQLRDIMGKARQQKIFFGICATDLKDIPTWIFRKLDGIFFCPYLTRYMFFKNRPRNSVYTLQEIRHNYTQKGYRLFYELKKQRGCLMGKTQVATPLTYEEEKQYLRNKANDYKKSMEKYLAMTTSKPKVTEFKSLTIKRDALITKMSGSGMKQTEISRISGLTPRRIGQILENEALGA